MTTASSLDLIYMTTLQDTPYTLRPYVWDLIRFLQRKVIKIKKHSKLNGLQTESITKRVIQNLQNCVSKEFYSSIKQKKSVSTNNPLQLLFEFKFLTMTILKDDGEEELAFSLKKCHQGVLRLISRQKKDFIEEESCFSQ